MALLTASQFEASVDAFIDELLGLEPLHTCEAPSPVDKAGFGWPDKYGRFVINFRHRDFRINRKTAMELRDALNEYLGAGA